MNLRPGERELTTAISARLREVTRTMTPGEIGERLGCHPESIRRYRLGTRLSVHFLAMFCQEYGVNVRWLLWNEGPVWSD